MEIRDATENDVEAIAKIYQSYVRTSIATLEEHEPTTDSICSEFSKVFSSGSPFIVAVDRDIGSLCGYAYTGPFNERSGYKFTREDSVYLHPDYCGKGLGRQLLQKLFETLKATSSATQVVAKMSILPEQAVEDLPSCRLHMSIGFKAAGRLSKDGYKFDKWIDVVLLQADIKSI